MVATPMSTHMENQTVSTGTKTVNILRLDIDRSNWSTWKMQILAALKASKGVMWHTEGTARKLPTISEGKQGPLTEEEDKALHELEKHWDKYYSRENSVQSMISMIFQSVFNKLLNELSKFKTAKEV
jgi:hypothetical protein